VCVLKVSLSSLSKSLSSEGSNATVDKWEIAFGMHWAYCDVTGTYVGLDGFPKTDSIAFARLS